MFDSYVEMVLNVVFSYLLWRKSFNYLILRNKYDFKVLSKFFTFRSKTTEISPYFFIFQNK